jgi:hypothetical protein
MIPFDRIEQVGKGPVDSKQCLHLHLRDRTLDLGCPGPVTGPVRGADREDLSIAAQETTRWHTNGAADLALPEIGGSPVRQR